MVLKKDRSVEESELARGELSWPGPLGLSSGCGGWPPGRGCPQPRLASWGSDPPHPRAPPRPRAPRIPPFLNPFPPPGCPLPRPRLPVPALTAPGVGRRALRLAPQPRRRRRLRPRAADSRPRRPAFTTSSPPPQPARTNQRPPCSPTNRLPRHNQSRPGLPLSDGAARRYPVTRMEFGAGPPCQPIGSRESRRC